MFSWMCRPSTTRQHGYRYAAPQCAYTETLRGFTCREDDVPYFGRLVGPVRRRLYGDYYYVDEDRNWQFLGELKEKYGEHARDEFWYVEQFHTLPWEYTEFVLPDIDPGLPVVDNPDLYLLTSAWLAPQSEDLLWTQDVAATRPHVPCALGSRGGLLGAR